MKRDDGPHWTRRDSVLSDWLPLDEDRSGRAAVESHPEGADRVSELSGQPPRDDPAVPATVLSHVERWTRVLRAGLHLFPFGIGSAVESGYFGTIDERRLKRLEEFLTALSDDLRSLHQHVVNEEYFGTDEFAHVFEGVLRRVNVEVAESKLLALRGVLLTVMTHRQTVEFEKQSAFLKTIDLLEGTHLRVLQLLAARAARDGDDRFLSHAGICRTLGAQTEADVNFVYSALDTLANREFIVTGPIPFDETGRIDKARQSFRITALGAEFLRFVRMDDHTPGEPAAEA